MQTQSDSRYLMHKALFINLIAHGKVVYLLRTIQRRAQSHKYSRRTLDRSGSMYMCVRAYNHDMSIPLDSIFSKEKGISICIYVYMYVCMYVCMYVYISIDRESMNLSRSKRSCLPWMKSAITLGYCRCSSTKASTLHL